MHPSGCIKISQSVQNTQNTTQMRELRIAYGVGFLLFLLCCSFTFTSAVYPHWFQSNIVVGDLKVHTSYGLARKCSSTQDIECIPFPQPNDCKIHGEAFCGVWRTSGFAIWATLMLDGGIIVAFMNILCFGNRFTQERGWKVLCGLILGTVVLQCFATLAMDVVLETNGLFKTGHWRVGQSWALATASWVLSLLVATSTAIVGIMTPTEYEMFYDSDLETEADEEEDDFQKYTRQTRKRMLVSYGVF